MAQVTITQLPVAQALTGAESIPIVQNGVTVQTTTGAVSGAGALNYPFLTVGSTSGLTQARYITTNSGLSTTDGGAGSTLQVNLIGAAQSLNASPNGIQVKTGSNTVTGVTLAVGAGLGITNADGTTGSPTINLGTFLQQLITLSGTGMLAIQSGSVAKVNILGTGNQTTVTNGNGAADVIVSLSDNPIFPGTGGATIPNGTSAQRSGGYGSIRYNTSLQQFEGNTSTGWNQFSLTGGVTSFSAGTTGFTPSTASTGAVILSGTLNVANGGTGGTATPIAGAVAYGNGTVYSFTAAGISGQVLTSTGAGTPTWTTPTTGTVTSVSGTAGRITSSGGATPVIDLASGIATPGTTGSASLIPVVTIDTYGRVTSITTAANPQGTVTAVSVVSANGLAGTSSGGATPALTLSTSITGVLKGNGTAISAAVSGTDYAPATSGSSILYGNAAGGFSNVTIGTGVSFAGGTLSATGSGGTVTSVTGTAPVVSSGGATPAISMAAATTSVNGYLTSTDWTTFNNKVTSVSGTAGRTTSTGGATPVIDLASGVATPGTTGSASLIPVVTIDTYGRVTSISTAANPQGTVTNVSGTSPVVSSGGTTPAISMPAATTSVSGYLTSTDWTTFNSKQNAFGSQTANYVYAAPNGSAGSPTFRALVAADIPALSGTYIPYTGATGAVDLNAQSLANVSHLGINTATVPTILFRAIGDNGASSRAAVRGYSSDANSSSVRVTKFRGSAGAPQVPQSGDSLGKFELAGYATTSSDGLVGGLVEGVTTEMWGATGRGTKILLKVTANTTTTQVTAVTIDQDKSVSLAGALSVTGHTTFEGVTSTGATGTGKLVYDTSPSFTTPALGTPSSGTVTNLTGTASININGTVGATSTNTGYFTTLTASADSSFTSTGALLISKGTTAQQPTPTTGMLRYNTTTNQFEGYSGSSPAWNPVGGASVSNDTTTATNVYPLFASATSGTATTLYTSNANYLYKPSTGELAAKALNATNGLHVNSQTVGTSYTIASGNSAMSAGPMTVSSGVVVTIPSGSRWVII